MNFDNNIAEAKLDRSDWGMLLNKVYAEIHGLLKYSSYYLGTCKLTKITNDAKRFF